MIGKTLLVINPRSGKGAAKRVLLPIVSLLSNAGCEVTVLPTKPGMATAEALSAMLACENRFDLVVACGGDGTLSLTVEGVLQSGRRVPIGYIPLGSTNDFASSLGIPSNYTDAITLLLAGNPVPHDVGLFLDRHFTYIACCGAFAETSYTTSQSLKNLLGHAAYVFNAIPSLSSLSPIPMTIEADGELLSGRFIFCALANTTTAGGLVKLDSTDVQFSDGLFELVLIRYPEDLVEAGRIATKLLASDLNDPAILLRHVQGCRIVSEKPVGWSLDGEDGGMHTSALLTVEKSAIDILK